MIRTLLNRCQFALAPLALAVGLSGCISLLPKSKPVQLYRLAAPAAAPAAPAARAMVIGRGPTTFTGDAAGDQILTVTGAEAAYIAQARWVEPAALMFDAALASAFDAPGAPRLAGRGDSFGAATTLRLDVRHFYADYDKGQGAPPTVEVQIHALLVRNADRSLVGDKLFDVRVPAEDNRVSAIVAAYGAAVGQAVAAVRDWAAATAAGVKG